MPDPNTLPTAEAEAQKQLQNEQPIREVSRDGVHYVLLGTAHVSRASVDAVTQMADSAEYDAIAV